MILVMTLILLSLFTLLGLAFLFTSSTDHQILYNANAAATLRYASESAVEEARDQMKPLLASGSLSLAAPNKAVYIVSDLSSIDPIGGSPDTNPYYDNGFSSAEEAALVPATLPQSGFSWVKIVPKTEARAGYSLENNTFRRTNPVCFGYHRTLPQSPLSQYVNTSANGLTHSGTPVFLVTALSRNPAGQRQKIQADLAAVPIPPLQAAFYSRSPVVLTGGTIQVLGDDEDLAQGQNLIGIQSQGDISGDLSGVQGSPYLTQSFSNYNYHMSSLLHSLQPPTGKDIEQAAPSITKMPDGSYTGDGLNLGLLPSAGDQPQTTYVKTDLVISNSIGQGILAVNGDLNISGNFVFYGLIIVKGRVVLSGSGAPGVEIHGAIIANGDVDTPASTLGGIVRIYNNSTIIQKAFSNMGYICLAIRQDY